MKPAPRNDEPAQRGRTLPPDDVAERGDALPPGSRVEEFEIERVLASSGFGIVYLATDRAFERRVAIKEYLPDTLATRAEDGVRVLLRAPSHAEAFERGRRAFVEEAQLLARLEHPSLLRVLRQWEANGTVYRAMPYYPGTPLLRLREAIGTPPDEATLRALLDGLLEPLALLHAAGCIHREITPWAILLLPDDRPVLMDWGAARRAIVGNQAHALMTLLAPSFAPPEVTAPAPQRPIGPWSDLHALGAVVRYCIGGQLPPPAALPTTPADEPLGRMLERLRRVYPWLRYSPSFVAAIDKALMPRPEDRPQDVGEFRALLDDHPAAFDERVEPAFDWRDDAPVEEPTMAPPPGGEPWTQTVVQMRPRMPASDGRPTTPFLLPEGLSPREAAPSAAPPPDDEPLLARPGDYGTPRAQATQAPRGGARRRGRRLAFAALALGLLAVAAGAWWLDRPRVNVEAQSALARAARVQGLPPVAVKARAPVVEAAPATAADATPEPVPAATTAAAEPAADKGGDAGPALPPRHGAGARKAGVMSSSGTRAAGPARPATRAGDLPARTHVAQGPRQACGSRTQFSLYRCMKAQCEKAQWFTHPSCERLRLRDEVD